MEQDIELQNNLTAILKNCPSYVNYHLNYTEKDTQKYHVKVFFLDNNCIICASKTGDELLKLVEKKLKRSIYWKQYILNFDLDL